MDRLIGTVAALILVVVFLPALAQIVQGVLPSLVGLLLVLALLRAWLPNNRGRHW